MRRRIYCHRKDHMENKELEIVNERVATTLTTHDFYYDLPEELIAQYPSEHRDGCRLMTLDKATGEISHKIFSDIIDFLNPEDMLVVNSSKVIPARLLGKTDKTGADMELLLLRMLDNGEWETLVRPGKRAKVGAGFDFAGELHATVTGILDGGNRKSVKKLLCDKKVPLSLRDSLPIVCLGDEIIYIPLCAVSDSVKTDKENSYVKICIYKKGK